MSDKLAYNRLRVHFVPCASSGSNVFLFAFFLLMTCLTVDSHGQITISSDTTQVSGTTTTPGNGLLQITHNTNNPLLTLTADGNFQPATRSAAAIVVGSTSGQSGQLLIESGSSLSLSNSVQHLETIGNWNVQSGFGYMGLNVGTSGIATVRGSSSQWTTVGLGVGISGNGSLSVLNGGYMQSAFSVLGERAGSSGEVIISGAGSEWRNVSDLTIGNHGTGSLKIESGGQLLQRFNNRPSQIGMVAGSSGTATVTGTGSKWINSGSLTVGNAGNGSLTIENGGHVSNSFGTIGSFRNIPQSSVPGSGNVVVRGPGSLWTNSARLTIGDYGNGSLTIDNGGQVTSDSGVIGWSKDQLDVGTGSATIRGSGSSWILNDSLSVGGKAGTGNLTIENGGRVSNRNGFIGSNSLKAATATVTGANSIWTNSNLSVTQSPHDRGTLTIADGGTVKVSETTSVINIEGAIYLQSGGTLETRNFRATPGSFHFSGGTLRLTGGVFTGGLDLEAGTTLAGIGTVTGDLSLSGTLDPGFSPGTFIINGDLTWNSDGLVMMDVGAASDLIAIGGDLLKGSSLGDGWYFHFSNAGDFEPGIYTLMTFASTDFSFDDFSFTSDISGFGGQFIVEDTRLLFAAVPEPSSLLLLGLTIATSALRRRRF